MAKVLVTGGAGFIGSHLCDDLLAQGDEVVCVDNLVGTRGKTENMAYALKHPGFTFVQADIRDWEIDFSGVDCVYHQAASKAVNCLRDPELDLEVNARGTLRLLMAAQEQGVRKFVHASSGSVYGESGDTLAEDHPLRPVSYYGISKLAGESYCAMFAKQGMDVTVLRYFHVIGPRQSTVGVVPWFVRRALGNLPITVHGTGNQTRSFTSVDDVVRANILASDGEPGIYNCASGISVTINELAQFIVAEMGSESEILHDDVRPGDIEHFAVDNSAIGIRFNQDWRNMVRGVIAWEVRE